MSDAVEAWEYCQGHGHPLNESGFCNFASCPNWVGNWKFNSTDPELERLVREEEEIEARKQESPQNLGLNLIEANPQPNRAKTLFFVATTLTYGFLCIAVGVLIGYITFNHDLDDAYCPMDDSCWVDYYDGEWHVIEGDPPWEVTP